MKCERFIFVPFAVETSGGLRPAASGLLKELGQRLTARTGDKREAAWLSQRVSLAVARGNAASVLATAKSDADWTRPSPFPPPAPQGQALTPSTTTTPALPPGQSALPAPDPQPGQAVVTPAAAPDQQPTQPASVARALTPPQKLAQPSTANSNVRRLRSASTCCPRACASWQLGSRSAEELVQRKFRAISKSLLCSRGG